jgi:hypothetical protein
MSVLCPFIAASTSGVSPSSVVFQHQLFLLTSYELFPLAHILQPTVTLKSKTIVCCVDIDSVKGSGRGRQHQQQPPALGEEGDFALHASVCGKVQAKDNVNPNNQERKGKRKMLVLARAGLYSFLCRLCAICQSV